MTKMRRTLPLSVYVLVGISVVAAAAAAAASGGVYDVELPESLENLNYENITISDLLIEINKTIPDLLRRSETVFDKVDGYSCKGHCGTLTTGLCSCRPTCYPAGNCCFDFQAECPLEFERLQTDLWWLRYLEMSCLLSGVMGVSSCPRPGSAIHKDQFTPAVKTTTPSQQNNYDKEWQDALAEGKKDPRLRNFKKREAVVWESGTSLTTQVDGDRKRRRRFVDGRVPQEEGLTGADTSPIPDSPTTPVVGANAYGETSTPRASVQPKSLFDNEDTTAKDDTVTWTTLKTSPLPQDTPDGQGSQVDNFRHAITDLHITDVDTGLIFINASVFACHSHLVKNPVFWDAVFLPNTGKGLHGQAAMEDLINETLNPATSVIPSVGATRDMELCYSEGTPSCPENYPNKIVVKRCRDAMALVLYKVDIYKNPFCVVCNYTPNKLMSFVPISYFTQGRRVGIFRVTMKVRPDFQTVSFALSTTVDKSTAMLYPNWKEYECQLNYRVLAASVADGGSQDNSGGQSLFSMEIKGKEKRSEVDEILNSQLPRLDSDTTKQNIDHCELLSCRVGKKLDNRCEAEWYLNVRFPPVFKPLCPEIFNTLEPSIVTLVNHFSDKLSSSSSRASLLGVDKGSYVYQYVFTARSFFDLSLDKSTPDTINYVITSVLISVGIPMTNGSFCVFHGLNTNEPIPKHEISYCSEENKVVPMIGTSSSYKPEFTCSGQECSHFSWVCGLPLIMTVAYMTQ